MRLFNYFKFLVLLGIGLNLHAFGKSPAFFVIGQGPKIFTIRWNSGELVLADFTENELDQVDFSTNAPPDFANRAIHYRQYLRMRQISSRDFHDLVAVNGPKKGFHIISRSIGNRLGARETLIDEIGYISPHSFPEEGVDHLYLLRYVRGPNNFQGMVVMDKEFRLGYQALAGTGTQLLFSDLYLPNYTSVDLAYLSSGETWGKPSERLVMAYTFGQIAGRQGLGVAVFRLQPLIPTKHSSRRRKSGRKVLAGYTLRSDSLDTPDSFIPVPGYPLFHSSDPTAKELLHLFFAASKGECAANLVISSNLQLPLGR